MNNFSKWRKVAHQRSYAAPASFAAVSVPGGSWVRTLLSHKQLCQPYPASRRLTMNNRNKALPVLLAPTGRNQTQCQPRPVAYLRRYDFTLAWPA